MHLSMSACRTGVSQAAMKSPCRLYRLPLDSESWLLGPLTGSYRALARHCRASLPPAGRVGGNQIGAPVSSSALSRARSFRLARRIAVASTGVAIREKPAGAPLLRRVIRVPAEGVSSQV